MISAGGVGALIGSLFASRVINRFGLGPALIWTAIGASVVGVLTPLAQGPILIATLMVFIPQLVGDGLQTIESVAETSLIQGLVPDRVLGRVNATLETFSHGIAYPLGALLAAALAGVIGVRGGIAIGWAGHGDLAAAARAVPAAAHPPRGGLRRPGPGARPLARGDPDRQEQVIVPLTCCGPGTLPPEDSGSRSWSSVTVWWSAEIWMTSLRLFA